MEIPIGYKNRIYESGVRINLGILNKKLVLGNFGDPGWGRAEGRNNIIELLQT
jgi:hypothetical protein